VPRTIRRLLGRLLYVSHYYWRSAVVVTTLKFHPAGGLVSLSVPPVPGLQNWANDTIVHGLHCIPYSLALYLLGLLLDTSTIAQYSGSKYQIANFLGNSLITENAQNPVHGSAVSSRHAGRSKIQLSNRHAVSLPNRYLGLNKCSSGSALSNRHADRYQIVIIVFGHQTKPSKKIPVCQPPLPNRYK
jgi:hypothetical protein